MNTATKRLIRLVAANNPDWPAAEIAASVSRSVRVSEDDVRRVLGHRDGRGAPRGPRSRRATHDYLTEAGAKKLKNRIDAYWAGKHAHVSVRVELDERASVFVVRSDLVNGVPSGGCAA